MNAEIDISNVVLRTELSFFKHDVVNLSPKKTGRPEAASYDSEYGYQTSAITSTSTSAPLGRLRPPTQERAGLVVKYSP